ncbi:multidrug resistance protein MdtA [Geobacter sp. OR-1]|uniref:efflux RND transporter periplasmic adaptor subunit n=1 Tax=Geobacter sp. OR-1 TaxID=1266765 RepID=UPI000542802B|nr:efflux RND transporter periplasmic adaptor subunit [Geobacter sp. OR-1]GAM08114.1 multidrug resistance protein MdtA [Geobacter sp. OR-1]
MPEPHSAAICSGRNRSSLAGKVWPLSIRIILAALLALSVSACSDAKKKEAPKGRPPSPVLTAFAAKQSVPVQLEAIGNVEPLTTVSVKSMVNGEVTRVHFKEGQDVAKGQLLFTIDPRQPEAALRQAEAAIARTRAQLVKARTDADRYAKLVKDGIVTQDQYETYRTQADSLSADVSAQEALIQNLRVQLSYCTIRSPLQGRTGNLMIHEGNVVKANDSISLVTINQMSPITIAFNIPEKELIRVRPQLASGNMTVAALPSGDMGKPETGRVTFLDNTVDPATGTIKLKATFSNANRRLWPGQFATVRMTLATLANATVVPTQAMQTGQQGQYVFVVKADNTAELRPVKAGPAHNGVTVVEQGINPGEQVVIDGQMRLIPGAQVTVRKQGEKPGQSPPAPATAQSRQPAH